MANLAGGIEQGRRIGPAATAEAARGRRLLEFLGDMPSVAEGLWFLVVAGMLGYFFVDQRPWSCIVAVVVAYAILIADRLARSR